MSKSTSDIRMSTLVFRRHRLGISKKFRSITQESNSQIKVLKRLIKNIDLNLYLISNSE